jgi:16S rRNA (cytosine1402-N4)-methyltransferase
MGCPGRKTTGRKVKSGTILCIQYHHWIIVSEQPVNKFDGGFSHRPVLYQEIIHALKPRQSGFYVDGTLGAGGHALGILEASAPDGRLLGLDVDPKGLEIARRWLSAYGNRLSIVQASYATLSAQLERIGWKAVDGVLLDLGVSSMQLDDTGRGFSFQADAYLDMRFNPDNPVTAADLVNSLSEDELATLIYRYGDEHKARQIASAIVQARPLSTTTELAEIIARVASKGSHRYRAMLRKKIHPATRTFQALRIAVNRELEALETTLPQAVNALIPGGRLAVISFHSLEDRIVKQYFRRESQDCLCPPRQPQCTCGHKACLVELVRRPVRPQMDEIEQNPRSRSARLRIVEKITR